MVLCNAVSAVLVLAVLFTGKDVPWLVVPAEPRWKAFLCCALAEVPVAHTAYVS